MIGPNRPARRLASRTLALPHEEPTWMRYILVVFMITLFIPKSVALSIGSIALTPALASAIILFPALAFSGRIKYAWPDMVVLLFMLAMLLSILQSAPLGTSIEAFGRGVLSGGVPYLIGRYLGSRPNVFNPFMRRLMTVMAVLAVFLVFESWFRINIHSILWSEPYTPHKEMRMGLTRAYGWTSHSIMLGVSYAVFIPIMMIAAMERINNLGRLRWLKLGLFALGVFCSLSTGAWLPAALGVALVLWDYFKMFAPGHRWLIVSLGGVSTYLILEVLSGRPLLRILMMELHLSSPMAWYYRWELYRRVYAVMPGYEWFGHGIKTPANMISAWQWSIDNNYLVILMQYGRVGLTLWIGIFVSVFVYGWKAVWNASDTPYRRVARAVMIAIATVALTQLSVALFSTAAMLNWLFLGLGVGLAQGLANMKVRKPQRKAPATGSKRSTSQFPGEQVRRPIAPPRIAP